MVFLIGYYYLFFIPLLFGAWVAAGVLVSLTGFLFPAGRARVVAVCVIAATYLVVPGLVSIGMHVASEFDRQRDAAVAAQCLKPNVSRPAGPTGEAIAVEGFIDATDHDALVNDRFQRNADDVARNVGGQTIIDAGSIPGHSFFQVVRGRTFSEQAHLLLTQRRFSYVEVEMRPGKDGYANAGTLNTKDWRGNRYRLYYLVPLSLDGCNAEQASVESYASTTAKPDQVFDRLMGMLKTRHPDGMCPHMDITLAPVGNVRVVADEVRDRLHWRFEALGLSLPVWTPLLLERMRIVQGDSTEIAAYSGFLYPNETAPSKTCLSAAAGREMLERSLAPSPDRAFLRSRTWYPGSVVQRFYEPDAPDPVAESRR